MDQDIATALPDRHPAPRAADGRGLSPHRRRAARGRLRRGGRRAAAPRWARCGAPAAPARVQEATGSTAGWCGRPPPRKPRSGGERRQREVRGVETSQRAGAEPGLQIKIVDVAIESASRRVTVAFNSDERVDFRDLVRDLAHEFHARIEMKQIGARDTTKLMDGIGPCGRQLCCSSHLKKFDPISVKMAKGQDMPLTDSRLLGNCGRLKCCLLYEFSTYEELRRRLPKVGSACQAECGGSGCMTGQDQVAARAQAGGGGGLPGRHRGRGAAGPGDVGGARRTSSRSDGRPLARMSQRAFYLTTPIYYLNARRTSAARGPPSWPTPCAATGAWPAIACGSSPAPTSTGTRSPRPRPRRDHAAGVRRRGSAALYREDMAAARASPTTTSSAPPSRATRRSVQAILQDLWDRGEIYLGEYGGQYCYGCERFYTEKEIVDGKCPDHQTPLTFIKEDNYFFRMSKYQARLIKHLEDHPDFIQPDRYRNEVLGFLREPLQDLSISRPRSSARVGHPLALRRRATSPTSGSTRSSTTSPRSAIRTASSTGPSGRASTSSARTS